MNQQIQQRDGYSQLAMDLLAKAKASGATEADIIIADGETFSVQVRLGAVDRLTKAREKHLGLRVFVGKRSASTSTSDFSADSLNQLVAETCILAKAVVEDPVSGLPAADQMAGERPDLDLYDSTRLNTEQQIDLAKRVEAAAMSSDERVTNSEGGDFDSSSGRVVLGNSHGFLGEYQSSSFSMAASPVATDPKPLKTCSLPMMPCSLIVELITRKSAAKLGAGSSTRIINAHTCRIVSLLPTVSTPGDRHFTDLDRRTGNTPTEHEVVADHLDPREHLF